jgi:hypothetical protein
MLTVLSDFIGWSDNGIHGIAVGAVKEVTAVIVTTLGSVSSGHVRNLIGFFLCVLKLRRKKGKTQFKKKGGGFVPLGAPTLKSVQGTKRRGKC